MQICHHLMVGETLAEQIGEPMVQLTLWNFGTGVISSIFLKLHLSLPVIIGWQ